MRRSGTLQRVRTSLQAFHLGQIWATIYKLLILNYLDRTPTP